MGDVVGHLIPDPCENCGAKMVYITVTGTSCDWCGHTKTKTGWLWRWFR